MRLVHLKSAIFPWSLSLTYSPTITFFSLHIEEIMAQSSRSSAKGQRKGMNVRVGVTPPPTPSATVSDSSAGSGAAISAHNNTTQQEISPKNKKPTMEICN
jgi:hypothetical protein